VHGPDAKAGRRNKRKVRRFPVKVLSQTLHPKIKGEGKDGACSRPRKKYAFWPISGEQEV